MCRLTQKGLVSSLRAFARLDAPNAVSGDRQGWQSARVAQAEAPISVADRVHFSVGGGYRAVDGRLRHLVAAPSPWEGFGLVLLEAMA
ncbi:MAG: hypothetical protein IPK17_37430 [Chloroflexi bacterium]|uniref:hypothetical protein n=1 Tax=Candidatus Flexifilum breve TaxID=3140694 RepID=UPI003134D508|nr:hypothetical protein [Chloroflexota bacterium]